MVSKDHKLSVFIVGAAHLPLDELAQQYFALCAEGATADEGTGASERVMRLAIVIDAIGLCRFGNAWTKARDNTGFNQDAA